MSNQSKNYSVEFDDDVAIMRLHETVSVEEILRILGEVAQTVECRRRLWDATEHFVFTAEEISQIAERAKQHWPASARVAYLASDQLSFDLLLALEMHREQADYETRVFRDEVEALAWLREWRG